MIIWATKNVIMIYEYDIVDHIHASLIIATHYSIALVVLNSFEYILNVEITQTDSPTVSFVHSNNL